MKAVLQFNLDNPDDRSRFLMASKAIEAYLALNDISEEVFRPHRKFGYQNKELDKLLDNPDVIKAISLLEEQFHDILKMRTIDLGDLL